MDARIARILTPERRFYLAAARLNPDLLEVERSAAEVRSWETVVGETRRTLLAPLVSRSAETCAAVPDEVRRKLRDERYRSQAMGGYYLQRAGEVLEQLTNAGLSPVVLKGVALIEMLYGDPALRPFCDVDILLARESLEAAERVLLDLGYRAEGSVHPRAWYFDHYYQLPRYARRARDFCVELHWDLGRHPYPFRLDVPAMLARATPLSVGSAHVRRLENEDFLLHLIIHLTWGNGFDAHVRGVVDIAELVRAGIDWEAFVSRTIAANVAQAAVPALQLAAWLLQAPVPDDVLIRLSRHRGGRISRYVTNLAQARVLDGGRGHRTIMRLAWLGSMRDRLTLLRENVGSDGHAITRALGSVRSLAGALSTRRPA